MTAGRLFRDGSGVSVTQNLRGWLRKEWRGTRIWRRRLPGARVEVFRRAGHYVMEDAHERLVPIIRDFLV